MRNHRHQALIGAILVFGTFASAIRAQDCQATGNDEAIALLVAEAEINERAPQQLLALMMKPDAAGIQVDGFDSHFDIPDLEVPAVVVDAGRPENL